MLKHRWLVLAVACALVAAAAFALLDWQGWVTSWLGAVFKAASGGAGGWFVSRKVCGLDLSSLDPEDRAVAGLSQSVLIAGGAIAVAFGS